MDSDHSGKAFKDTVVNQACHSIKGDQLENMFTVPLRIQNNMQSEVIQYTGCTPTTVMASFCYI